MEGIAMKDAAVLLHDREMGLTSAQSWIVAVASIFPGEGKSSQILFPSQLDGLTCVNSVVAAKRVSGTHVLSAESHSFYASAGLIRTRAFHPGPEESVKCHPKVLLLHNSKSSFLQNTSLLGDLQEELGQHFGADVVANSLNLGLLPPFEQFKAVYSADVLISPSSQDLANLLFVRPNTLVIEVRTSFISLTTPRL